MAEKIKLGSNGNFGVKEGGTLAYNDENGVFKAIELASSRASGATYVAESGLIADAEVGVPRIDYTNGVGELLLEPQRRNLFPYSEDFSVADWTKQNATITSNYAISPDGTMNASRLQFTGAGSGFLYDFATYSSSTDYTISFYLKSNGAGQDLIRLYAQGNSANLTATNEWVRHTYTFTGLGTSKDSGLTSVSTEGNVADVLIWGLQVESDGASGGSDYATSYIRTSGSSVTRIADAVTGNSSLGQVINSSEGVLYAEMSALADDGANRVISISDGTTSNRFFIYYTATSQAGFKIDVGGVQQDLLINSLTQTNIIKIAAKYKDNDFALWINGVEVDTGLSGTTFSSGILDNIQFDNGAGANPFYGRIKELKVYDTALTDSELQTLTTL